MCGVCTGMCKVGTALGMCGCAPVCLGVGRYAWVCAGVQGCLWDEFSVQ